MKVRIHRGTKEIGGICIELNSSGPGIRNLANDCIVLENAEFDYSASDILTTA